MQHQQALQGSRCGGAPRHAQRAAAAAAAACTGTPRPARRRRCTTSTALLAPPLDTHCIHKPRPIAAAAAASPAAEPAIDARQLMVKLSVAANTGRLDLSDLRLPNCPPDLFNISDLEELSLAGNDVTDLPAAGLANLTALRRLVVAGNRLSALPDSLSSLTQLEGLWAHGNQIQCLPEGVGALTALRSLSLAGNRLASLPQSLAALTSLQDLSLSGNLLTKLPDGVAALQGLTRLAVNGNALTALPNGWGSGVGGLRELHLQGNQLETLPEGMTQLPVLSELSVADNLLHSLPTDLSGWKGLQKLHLYGNRLRDLPVDVLLSLPSLQQLWLEGNPLQPTAVEALLQRIANGGAPPALRALGLDDAQIAGVCPAVLEAAHAARPGLLRVGAVAGGPGPGYFKIQRAAITNSSSNSSSEIADGSSSGDSERPRVLVVAFGSAPGLPNWGGALRQVATAMEKDGNGGLFDVLFVVDPSRDWYQGGDAAAASQTYRSRLASAVEGYGRVLFVGDSMGATAALLFADLATTVLAFCPQVDLTTASIRPGRPGAWFDALQSNIHTALDASSARVRVLTGTWQHDLAQAALLEHHSCVALKAYGVDSHRLALALARGGKLAPLLQEAIANEANVSSRANVRLANML